MTTNAPRTLPPLPSTGSAIISVSVADMARAFTEWDRRYREEPEKFMSEVHHLLKETAHTYGDACALYFSKLISETMLG